MLKIFKDITQYCNSTVTSSQNSDSEINIIDKNFKNLNKEYIRYRVDYLFYKDSFSNFLIKKFPYTIRRNKNILFYFFCSWASNLMEENSKPEYNKVTEFISDEVFYKLPNSKYSAVIYTRSLRFKR